jgi:hypothetical protein
MRKLSDDEATALHRFIKQREQLRRVERSALTFRASNALIDRIISDVGDADNELMVRLLTQKANTYRALQHREVLLGFVKKLLALSSARARAIEELEL